MKTTLMVVGGNIKASEITLRLPAVIGRGREATLALPHPLVSRRHCELFETNGTLMVRDLGSLNGTYVGNQRVDEAPVPSGELLTIATVSFRVVCVDSPDDNDTKNPQRCTGEESTEGRRDGKDPPTMLPAETVNQEPSETPEGKGDIPIDRDTQLQTDSAPPKERPDDDLSSFLDGHPDT